MKKIYLILIIAIILTYIIPKLCNNEMFDTLETPQQFKSIYDKTPKQYQSNLSFTSSPHMNCCLVERKLSLKDKKFAYKYTMMKDDQCNINLYNMDNSKQLFIEGDNNWTNLSCKPTIDLPISTNKPNTDNNKTYDDTLFQENFKQIILDGILIDIAKDDSLQYIPKDDILLEKKQVYNKKSNKPNRLTPAPDNTTKYQKLVNKAYKIVPTNEPKQVSIGSCRFANKECIDFIDKKLCDRIGLTWSTKSCYEKLPYKFIDKVKIHVPTFDNGDGTVNLFPVPDVPINCDNNNSYFPRSNIN